MLAAAVAALALVAALPRAVWAATPRIAEILPEGTVLVLEVPSVSQLKERFARCSWGRMLDDPQVRPLVERFMSELSSRWTTNAQEAVGLSLPDLLALPAGPAAWAIVVPDEGLPAFVGIVDVGPNATTLDAMLMQIGQSLVKQGGGQVEEVVAGIRVRTFDRLGPAQRRLSWFAANGLGVFGTDTAVVNSMAAAVAGQAPAVLAASDRYNATMQACSLSSGGPAVLTAYLDPVGLFRGAARSNAGMQLASALLPVLGLNGIEAAGAQLALDAGQFDYLLQGHLILSPQRTGVLEILGLRPVDAEPEAWVPAEANSYITLAWKFEASLQALSRVFDSFRGEGAMAGMIDRLLVKNLGIDLAGILAALDGRVSIVTWTDPTALPMQSRMLAGVRVKDVPRMRQALERIVQQQPSQFTIQSYQGQSYWEVKVPALPTPPNGLPPPQPQPCFGLMDDYALIANHPTIYQKVLATNAQRSGGLTQALEFKLVSSRAARLTSGKPSVVGFDRPEENIRTLYAQWTDENRRRQLREAGKFNPLLTIVDTAIGSNPLPPFETFERYFAPGGFRVVDDVSGLHFTRFGLRRGGAQ